MYLFLHVHTHCFTQHQINLHDSTLIQSVSHHLHPQHWFIPVHQD